MKVDRYIRAYNKGIGTLMFEILLPSNSMTFLSTLDFLEDSDDPLFYGCYDLTDEQTDLIHSHFFKDNIADTDYFDYQLECDRLPQKLKVKTKEELLDCLKINNSFIGIEDCIRFMRPSLLGTFKDLCYKIYQQGVSDGRL